MKSFFTTILLVVVLIPTSVFAEEAANNFLVGIPGVGDPTGDFDGYINAIYAMFISLAALLAVVKIVIAGVRYMFSDIVTQKSQAKKDIQGALFGLVIVLGAVLILTVINPDLTNFNLDTDMIERPDRPKSPVGSSSDRNTCTNSSRCTAVSCESSDCQIEITQCESEKGRFSYTAEDGTLFCIGNPTLYENLCGPDGSGCVNSNCRFARLSTCSDACQNDGGYFHESGSIAYGVISGQFDSCSIPINDRSVDYIPCARLSTVDGETYDCTVPAEGETRSAIDICTEGGTNNNFAYETVNVNFVNANTPQVTCVTTPSPIDPLENSASPVEIEIETGNALLDEYLTENNLSNAPTIYAINTRLEATGEEITITEELILDWADDCELNPDGSETGNTFVDIRSGQAGVSVWACAN